MTERKEMRACRQAAISETCRVCLDKAHGCHFGVFVCRACAAFFRRTVALNMIYNCRFNNCCEIDKSVRCMCRACRYVKCLKVGMNSDSVQLNRDRIKKNKKQPETFQCQNTEPLCGGSPPSDVEPHLIVDEAESELFNKLNNMFNDAAVNPRTSVDFTPLEIFRMALNHVRKRRLEVHTEVLTEMESLYGTEEFDIRLHENWKKVNIMMGKEIELQGELLSFFSSFVNLPADQRWLLFKNFSMSFIRFERAYETYRILGDNPNDVRTITFNGQAMNLITNIMHEAPRLQLQKKYNTVMKVIGPSRNFLQRGIINPIRELKLSETEFAALCLHLLWLEPGPDVLTSETQQIMKQSRREVFADLHNYYVHSFGMTTYATRIADFMALMSALEKNVFQQKENIIMANVFTTGVINPKVVTLTR